MYNVVDWSCAVWCILMPYSGPSTGVTFGNVVWDISKRGVLRFRSLKVKNVVCCTIELIMCLCCLCQRFVCWYTSGCVRWKILRRLARSIKGSRSLEVSWGITYTGHHIWGYQQSDCLCWEGSFMWARCGCGSYYRTASVAPCWRHWLIR